jgi:signal transduction histidine kinase
MGQRTSNSPFRDATDHRSTGRPPVTAELKAAIGPVAAGAGAAAFAVAGICLAAAVIARGSSPYSPFILITAQVIGVFFLVCGLFVWVRQPDGARMGRLLVAVGVTWYIGDLQFSSNPLVFTLGFWLYHLGVVVLAHLLLAYPNGRLTCRAERVTVIALYTTTLLTQGLRVLTESPLQPQGWGDPHAASSVWSPVGSVVGLLLTMVVVGLVVRRWRAEPRPARRARALFWAAVSLIGAVVALSCLAALVRAPLSVQGVLLLAYAAAQMVLGVAVLSGSLRMQLAHRRVSRLAAELQPWTTQLESLQDKLAGALEDPSLTLHYRWQDPDGPARYVDLRGRPAPLPPESDSSRKVTFVGPADKPLAALVHDPFLTQQPQQRERLDAVKNIAGLALEIASLHAAQQAHLRDVVEVEQATEAATRRHIQAMLHDGPQHRLSALQGLLGTAPSRDSVELHEIADELQGVVEDLREVTQGLYPSTLRWGLAAALDPLAQRSPVPLQLDVPAQLGSPQLERTAYFLISEAVGNAHKHADPTMITVRARETDGQLNIEVIDDGCGGATPRADGGGLRRWRDRVSALGGTFDVHSPPGAGTTVRVRLPCE